MKIYLATDHAAFELKEYVKRGLSEGGYDIEDCGAATFDPNDDYPDLIQIAAKKVAGDKGSFAAVFGKSGTGEAIVANKIKGVRAVIAFNEQNVKLAREHNNANVISIGSDFVNNEQAIAFIRLFVNTQFSSDERHHRRVDKISQLENE
jgi:ribose 5-phosphate isomerase B